MKIVAALCLLLTTGTGWSQTVYRCGNVYQDRPCPGSTIVDAQPNKGLEVRSGSGAIVHSRDGDKGRNARQLEQIHDNTHNAIQCGFARDKMTVSGGEIDCPTAKAQRAAKQVTPDYLRR